MIMMMNLTSHCQQDPHHGPHIRPLDPAYRRAHNDAFEGPNRTAFKVGGTWLRCTKLRKLKVMTISTKTEKHRTTGTAL
jgi:hypothetical protein